jgi:hypothetical protein
MFSPIHACILQRNLSNLCQVYVHSLRLLICYKELVHLVYLKTLREKLALVTGVGRLW